jgi:hypothetical protein
MRGLVSFHALDLSLIDEFVAPLVAAGKINPESFLEAAHRFRRNGWQASRYADALARLLDEAEAPRVAAGTGLLGRVRSEWDRLRNDPDERIAAVQAAIEVDLHLEGRPFLITEGSADRVAALVDEYLAAPSGDAAESLALEQIARLGPLVARGLTPEAGAELTPDFNYRRDVLEQVRVLFDLPRAAREGATWRAANEAPRPAAEALVSDLAWHASAVHALVRPFWIARDVDGIETVCAASGVPAPGFPVPAWRLVGPVLEEFPALPDALSTDLRGPRSVGALVTPDDVPELQDFLAAHGARIIREAARHGEGATCTTLLKKIRECLTFAEARGYGYLEASGIVPPYLDRSRFLDE